MGGMAMTPGDGFGNIIILVASLPALALSAPAATSSDAGIVVLARSARNSMSAAWSRYNEHWDEQGDRNTMERMLGTLGPTQREFLGCLQGRIVGDTILIEGWVPAADLKQLPMAVAGNCDRVTDLLGTWHTHPYRPDHRNLPVKERRLSAQDLATFAGSKDRVTLAMWDVDSVDAAVKRGGRIVHPAPVVEQPAGQRGSGAVGR